MAETRRPRVPRNIMKYLAIPNNTTKYDIKDGARMVERRRRGPGVATPPVRVLPHSALRPTNQLPTEEEEFKKKKITMI